MLTTIRRPTTGLLTAAAMLLAACGGSSETPGSDITATGAGQETNPSAPPATSAPTSEASPTTPSSAGTEPASEDGSGEPITVTDIELGERSDGVDRIVLHTAGGGSAGWNVQYVEEAQQQGSGNEVELEGDAVLEVLVTNSGYPFDTGEDEFSGEVDTTGADVVRDVSFQGVFEGQAQLFIGLDGRHPFRVVREDPSRIVIEILHG